MVTVTKHLRDLRRRPPTREEHANVYSQLKKKAFKEAVMLLFKALLPNSVIGLLIQFSILRFLPVVFLFTCVTGLVYCIASLYLIRSVIRKEYTVVNCTCLCFNTTPNCRYVDIKTEYNEICEDIELLNDSLSLGRPLILAYVGNRIATTYILLERK